jgi:hypothetical protein
MALAKFYPAALAKAFNKEIDWDSDAIYAALVTTAYTYSDAHDYWNDVVANELAAGSGYTANGVALSGLSITSTAANSWATVWATATAYKAGTIVRPITTNNRLYRAQGDGTSHAATEPTWPTTIGATVVDNGVTWTCVGSYAVALVCTDPSWSGITFSTVRYVVIYDRTPGTDATRPLIGVIDYGGAQSISNALFTVDGPATGILVLAVV